MDDPKAKKAEQANFSKETSERIDRLVEENRPALKRLS